MKPPPKLHLAGLVLLALTGHLRAQVAFAPTTNYVLYVQPGAVAAADVNGDGKVDLISVSSSVGMTVLTNNGSGGFRSNATYTAGVKTVWVTAADVNGDGKADLISANEGVQGLNNSTLGVFTNDGSGRFVLSSALSAAGSRSYAVAAADVNGDGKLDLISANALTPIGTLLIFTNNGVGGFALASSPAVGNDPLSVVAADVNGDSWVDLICANYNGKNLSVLTNNGSGGFALASSPGVGPFPLSVVAADVNGDGWVDLISANSGSGAGGNSLSVLTNNGSGGFAPAATNAVGTNPCAVVATDVNGDGKIDLISANFVDSKLSVLTNNGSGVFTLALTCAVSVNPRGATAADVNGDGRADLISANFGGGSLSVLINIPTLAIKNPDNSVVVSWPSSWTNWTLLQNTNPATTNWSASSGIADDGTNKSLTLPSPTDNLFFRLLAP